MEIFFFSQEVSYFLSLKNMDELYKVSLLTKQRKVFMIFQSLMKTMKVQCKNMTQKKVLMKQLNVFNFGAKENFNF